MHARLFALVAAAALSAPAAAEDTPEAVVKKAIKAHGGAAALEKYRAGEYRMKGSMALPGGDADFSGEVAYQLPDKYRMALDLKIKGTNVALVQVVNGKDVTTTVDGKPQKTSDAQKAEALASAAVQEITQLVPLLDDEKYQLKLGKEIDVAGSPAVGVAVTGAGLKDVVLYFDTKTGRLVRTSRKGLAPGDREDKPVTEDATLADFEEVSGVLVPTTMTVTHDGKKFMAVTVTDPKLSEKLDPKRFAAE